MNSQQANERSLAAEQALLEVEASLRRAPAAPAEAVVGAGALREKAREDEKEHAPIILIHGVGNFEHGDVVAKIASNKVYNTHGDFRRQTIYADNYLFTLLEDDKPTVDGRTSPRFLEVNWSEVRKPLSTVLGLLRNFVMVVLALARIGVYGAQGSRALGKPLRTPIALYVLEGMLVWASLLPMLSALLWKVDVSSRLGLGLGIGLAVFYAAWLMRNISRPLLIGGVVFGLLTIAAGAVSCMDVIREQQLKDDVYQWVVTQQPGRDLVTSIAGALHSASIIVAGVVLTIVALEILLWMRVVDGVRSTWTQRFARVGCLWLPTVLLVIVQPLTVSAVLLTLDTPEQHAWGLAFERAMLFHPSAGQFAGSLVSLALLGAILMGALQYKLVNWTGRNGTMAVCLSVGILLLLSGRWADSSLNLNCRCCMHPNWLALMGLMLVGSGILTYQLYRDRRSWHLPNSNHLWHPSGDCARMWAQCLLWVFPGVMGLALGILFWHSLHGVQYLAPMFQHYGLCTMRPADLHVDQAFLQSSKYALALLPFATKPFAALLDALGDVFYFVVKQDSLQTRDDTLPRLGRAIQNLSRFATDKHLIICAHSQGTVIAAALLARLSDALKSGVGHVTLLTVGSPLSSLYEHFLGVQIGQAYAQLCASQPERFRWVNMCRPADYVGSSIDLLGVENKALLTPGEHMGYWSDAVLLQWLNDRSEGLSEQQSLQQLKPIVNW